MTKNELAAQCLIEAAELLSKDKDKDKKVILDSNTMDELGKIINKCNNTISFDKLDKMNKKSQNEAINDLLSEAIDLLENISCDKEDKIDCCVEKYINSNKDKFKTGNEALKEFKEVEDTLNIDGAFKFETKEFDGIPAFYMYSAKSDTLLQVYFAIKSEAGHIELSVDELMDKCK